MTGEAQTITLTDDIGTLISDLMPKIIQEYLAMNNAAEGLAGTEFTLTLEISDIVYSLIVKDGKDIDVKEGGLESPMVRIQIPKEGLNELVKEKNIEIMNGMKDSLTRQKYDVISKLKGTSVFKLTHEDGSSTPITAVFNGGETPKVTFTMTTDVAIEITNKRDNPVQMFMAGKLKLEGDMVFGMSIQPLFT